MWCMGAETIWDCHALTHALAWMGRTVEASILLLPTWPRQFNLAMLNVMEAQSGTRPSLHLNIRQKCCNLKQMWEYVKFRLLRTATAQQVKVKNDGAHRGDDK